MYLLQGSKYAHVFPIVGLQDVRKRYSTSELHRAGESIPEPQNIHKGYDALRTRCVGLCKVVFLPVIPVANFLDKCFHWKYNGQL